MDKQYLKAYVEKQDAQDGVLQVAVGSDETPDREGEVVKAEGWDLKNFKKNAVFLWSHNSGFGEQRPPIGKVTDVRIEGKKLLFKPVFDMADEFAAEIYRKYKDGFLNAFSVGFIPISRDDKNDKNITSAELLEISAVNIPANPKALVSLREAGIPISKNWEDWKKGVLDNPSEDTNGEDKEETKDDNESIEQVEEPDEKGVIGAHTTDTADLASTWSGSSARKTLLEWAGGKDKINFNKYKRGFAWFDESEPEKLDSYKLPHHVINNGTLEVVFRGVTSAMTSLLGARGGTDIPEKDRRGVWNHLNRHYRQFDREAPEFRFVEEQILKDFDIETVTEFIVIERKQVLDKELLKEIVNEIKPQQPLKEAAKTLNRKTEATFTNEDLKDSLVIADKALEIAFKKMKTMRGVNK